MFQEDSRVIRRTVLKLTPAVAERVAELLKAQSHTEMAAFGTALAAWLAADDPAPLEQVLGVAYEPGRSWRRQRGLQRRNLHVVAAAEASRDSPRRLAARWRRYASTAWPRHRHMDEVPSSLLGKPEQHLFYAMRNDPAPDPAPLSENQIRRILKAGIFKVSENSEIIGSNGTTT